MRPQHDVQVLHCHGGIFAFKLHATLPMILRSDQVDEGLPTSLIILLIVCVFVGFAAILWCFFTTCVGREALLQLRHWLRERRQGRTSGGQGWTPLPIHNQDDDQR
ncbi:hypothetical protein DL89DRAFT_95168 [Linderina pennispora]|uniref:Uncharacterized protein n=1 Tax=Linderina pennispora TaxID=61395 RepID=A0A1Y1VWV8_9FUNG|nr:uncharacterized protein DL89DRAFT_95168 [Linderina pennispora]ORX65779.1 hypothetical protein DL89DRAFT_95168 [Linderina pennispora]